MTSPADELLLEGLESLKPIVAELGEGAMLIGGLATIAWIGNSANRFPLRATRDVDLGIDRKGLRLTNSGQRVRLLLESNGFEQLLGAEQFRFVRPTPKGEFLVDLLVAPGASREEPPTIESGMQSLAAPGLAYAILRRPTTLELTLNHAGQSTEFALPMIKLDAAFVMKACLSASGVRQKPDRRITDTTDALMLAAICVEDEATIAILRQHANRSDVRSAVSWMEVSFRNDKSSASRRAQQFFEEEAGSDRGAEWAVSVSRNLLKKLNPVLR